MKQLLVKKKFLPIVKNEDKFIEAIQLCRILSAIQYNKITYAMMSEQKDFNTSLKLNLVINQAAVLYEGLKKFNTLKENLNNLASFRNNAEKIEEIFNETSFYNEVLHKIRIKVAFHYDKHVIDQTLEDFINDCIGDNENVIFIEGKTDLIKDMTFLLADNLNMRYILNLIKGKNLSYEEKFKILAKKLLILSELFCGILQEIIPELIEDYCELVEEKV